MSRRRNHPTAQRNLEDAVHAALKDHGWVLPTTPEEVADAERHLWEIAPSPGEAEPPTFEEVARPGGKPPRPFLADVGDCLGIEETLARAAREGGEISPEIEEAMRRDRGAAEANAEKDPDA